MSAQRLTRQLQDLEHDKFTLNSLGETSVRTVTEGDLFSIPSGLKNGFRVTTMDVGDTAVQLPPSPLVGRNALAVHNLSQTDTIYIGPTAGVQAGDAVGTSSGWDIGPGEGFNVDVTDAIAIYAIAPAGKTIRVKILEVS